MLHNISQELIDKVTGTKEKYILYPLPEELIFLEVQGVIVYNSLYIIYWLGYFDQSIFLWFLLIL